MKSTKKKNTKKNMAVKSSTPFLYILPAALVLIVMVFIPLGYGIWLSMTNSHLRTFRDPSFIGLKNYFDVFKDPNLISVFFRTVVWTVVNVAAHAVFGVALAILLNRKLPGKALIRMLLIIPWAIPQYIAALTWRGMFNSRFGDINIILGKVGIGPINWLTDPTYTFWAAVITNIWLGIPFMMMIALGGLQSISNDMYEAADLDGANGFQKVKNITLPLLKPVMVPSIVLGTVWTFNNVNIINIMSYSVNVADSQILITEVYRQAFTNFRYGYASAYAVVIFLILLLFSGFFVRFSMKDEV